MSDFRNFSNPDEAYEEDGEEVPEIEAREFSEVPCAYAQMCQEYCDEGESIKTGAELAKAIRVMIKESKK